MEIKLKEESFMKKIFEATKKAYFIMWVVSILTYASAGAMALYSAGFHYGRSGLDFDVLKSELKKRFLI